MKNVIYINCPGNPWIKVAKTLKEKYGYQPVYWIGSPEEDPDLLGVKKEFPNVIFHNSVDAWKGRFPKDIQELAVNTYIDVDFLKRHAHEELQAIKMMDRMDQDQRSFNFMERQRHFRNMIKSWEAVIGLIKPDIVVSQDIPHRLYDYVLNMICKKYDIPFVMFHHTQFSNRYFITVNSFYTIGDLFAKKWVEYNERENINIPTDMLTTYENVKKTYDEAAPSYMQKESVLQQKSDKLFYMTRLTIKKLLTKYRPYLTGCPAGPTIISHCAYDKRKSKKYEESEGNIYIHEYNIRKANRLKKKLKDKYFSYISKPNYNENYVVHFLHYQPEGTTCPGGDIFVDQSLCVEVLLKNLPKDYKVYVKEHPHQFLRYRIGHSGRMCDLYDDLVKNERVKLISTEEDTFSLIQHAKAVSTITGTVGWEAIVRKKPVIVFGICWYENYKDGVLRITKNQTGEQISHFINNYQYNEKSLLSYLAAVGEETYSACYRLNDYRHSDNYNEEDNNETIIRSILNVMEKK